MRQDFASPVVAMLWLVSLGALAVPASAQEFPFRVPKEQIAARSVADYGGAIDAIVYVLVHKFELPVPRGHVEVHTTRESFEQGLIKHLKIAPALAGSISEFAKGAVGGYTLLINEPVMGKLTWPQRIEELAHEVTHNLQLTLANRPGIARPQWLIEGFAEWLAFNVTDALGLDDLENARARLVNKVREVRRKQDLPRLLEVDTLADWVETRKKHGFDATYTLSFVITDFLIRRHSLSAVTNYFREFQRSQDHLANFRVAFGEDVDEFERALHAHLDQLLTGVVPSNSSWSGRAASRRGTINNRRSAPLNRTLDRKLERARKSDYLIVSASLRLCG
jgi:hypothetical protein